MTDYVQKYNDDLASLDSSSKAARAIYDSSPLGDWIKKYRGGMPGGWLAAIALWESGGNFGAPGDPSLGEVGYYQVAEYVPPLFGLPAAARLDPESNVCIASLEYALEGALFVQAYPQVKIGTPDMWKLARLAFAVGRAGSHALADAAQPLRDGDVYGSIVDYVNANGGMQLGSQEPQKVWYRVVNIDLQWKVGRNVTPGDISGPPTIPPLPPAGQFMIPTVVAYLFSKPMSPLALAALAALGVVGYLLYRRA